ncbi:DUF6282 family protein [Microbacterium lacticum]
MRDDVALVDLHFHAGPDIVHRRTTVREAGELYRQMNGWVVVKSHLGSTASSAYQARQEGLPVSGSLVLNEIAGGMSARAVELAAIEHGADQPARLVVYLPTLGSGSAVHHANLFHPRLHGRRWSAVPIFDDRGRPLPETEDVLRAVRDTRAVLASGHLSRDDSLRLVDAAQRTGVERVLLTHALHPMSGFDLADLLALSGLTEVWVETTVLSLLLHRVNPEHARTLLASFPRSVLSSDLGQPEQPAPSHGWDWAKTWLVDDGLLADVAQAGPAALLRA